MQKNEEQLLETENSSLTIEQLDDTTLDTITGGQYSDYKVKPTIFKDYQTDSTGGGSRTNTYKPSP